jgi:hypothetical protein
VINTIIKFICYLISEPFCGDFAAYGLIEVRVALLLHSFAQSGHEDVSNTVLVVFTLGRGDWRDRL